VIGEPSPWPEDRDVLIGQHPHGQRGRMLWLTLYGHNCNPGIRVGGPGGLMWGRQLPEKIWPLIAGKGSVPLSGRHHIS
jgi:hypothetical protein